MQLLCAITAKEEGITNADDITILQTAALFHDCGFVNVYKNHEEEGCRIAKEVLPDFDYTHEQIETICSIIMKTKFGSHPETLLEKIICDADLDYLGSDEYGIIADRLFKELTELKKIQNEHEWNRLQVQFLQSHRYWTKSAQEKRNKKKMEHLLRLKEVV